MELLEDSLQGVGYLLKDRVQRHRRVRRTRCDGSPRAAPRVDPAIVSQLLNGAT